MDRNLLNKLIRSIDEKKDLMVEIRRHLHANPELSFQEVETAKYIEDFYKGKDCKVTTGVGGNGLYVDIDSGKEGRSIAVRADFDALPICEENDFEYKSKNPGVMHACGHDGHTAYLMILADCLIEIKSELKGKIRIIHQHAEEKAPGGSNLMIKDGVLDGVEEVYGIHLITDIPFGSIFYRPGNVQTGRSRFVAKIQGKGGHGSSPHFANDAIVAASHFVVALQTIVSRRLNPFDVGSITIGSFDGKGISNVIKDSVTLEGDVRTMSNEVSELIEKEVKNKLEGIKAMFGTDYELEYANDYPVLHNDEKLTIDTAKVLEEYRDAIKELTNIQECDPLPASEDFAYYALERPAVFMYVGASQADGSFFPHHHPKFDINEESMLIAAKAMATVVLNKLK